jgi:hypothetical protein
MSFRTENNNEVGLTRTQSSELEPQTSQSNTSGGKYVPPHVRNRVVKEPSRGNSFSLNFLRLLKLLFAHIFVTFLFLACEFAMK